MHIRVHLNMAGGRQEQFFAGFAEKLVRATARVPSSSSSRAGAANAGTQGRNSTHVRVSLTSAAAERGSSRASGSHATVLTDRRTAAIPNISADPNFPANSFPSHPLRVYAQNPRVFMFFYSYFCVCVFSYSNWCVCVFSYSYWYVCVCL